MIDCAVSVREWDHLIEDSHLVPYAAPALHAHDCDHDHESVRENDRDCVNVTDDLIRSLVLSPFPVS